MLFLCHCSFLASFAFAFFFSVTEALKNTFAKAQDDDTAFLKLDISEGCVSCHSLLRDSFLHSCCSACTGDYVVVLTHSSSGSQEEGFLSPFLSQLFFPTHIVLFLRIMVFRFQGCRASSC